MSSAWWVFSRFDKKQECFEKEKKKYDTIFIVDIYLHALSNIEMSLIFYTPRNVFQKMCYPKFFN